MINSTAEVLAVKLNKKNNLITSIIYLATLKEWNEREREREREIHH